MLWLSLNLIVLSSFVPAWSEQEAATKPRIGLALGGGGTRGCAHVGVMRVLRQEGIPIYCIAGTSMGAIVGGLTAAGRSPAELERFYMDKSMIRAFDTVPLWLRLAISPVTLTFRLCGYRPLDGLYRGGRFANFIRRAAAKGRAVGKNCVQIEDLEMPFAAVTSDLISGETYVIKKGDLGKAIQASAAIPFLRKPVCWQGRLLVDGGVTCNLPVEAARTLGADFVIAVDVNDNLVPKTEKSFHKIGSVTRRALDMHLAEIDKNSIRQADLVVHPDVTNIALLSRKIKDARRAIAAGEKSARDLIPELRRRLSLESSTAKELVP